ncbi:hypothetical protein FOXYS1_15436, partial [Fusarium oxysporum]
MSPEEPPEGLTSFEDRDLRPGELLRWVYDTLPGVLLEDSATDRSAMERNDEEDFKKEVYKGFVGFEAKFSSTSGMHNFERVGDLNVGWSIEKEHVNEDIDIAVIAKRNTGVEPLDKQQNLRHDELLYRHLASHICTAERHQVLLQLPSPDSNTWHIRMPRCSHNMGTGSCYNSKHWWQETQIISVTIDNTLVSAKNGPRVPNDDRLDLCAENAAHLKRKKKQLHLLCNHSRISLHKDQSNTFFDSKKAQSWSNVKPLDDTLINFKRVDTQNP